MKTYYKWKYTQAYCEANYGRTGHERRGEGARLDSQMIRAGTWRVCSRRPEVFEFGDSNDKVVLKARAESIGAAMLLPDEAWKND